MKVLVNIIKDQQRKKEEERKEGGESWYGNKQEHERRFSIR